MIILEDTRNQVAITNYYKRHMLPFDPLEYREKKKIIYYNIYYSYIVVGKMVMSPDV